MDLRFVEQPEVAPEAVASLRKAVGWDERLDRIKRSLPRVYYRAGCFDGEKLVGYIEIISEGVDDAYIRNLMVHPAYRRRGIGLRLLQMVKARTEAEEIKTINVLFEPGLAPFYRKAGFRIVGGGLIDNETSP